MIISEYLIITGQSFNVKVPVNKLKKKAAHIEQQKNKKRKSE